jgi:hypothetical protein
MACCHQGRLRNTADYQQVFVEDQGHRYPANSCPDSCSQLSVDGFKEDRGPILERMQEHAAKNLVQVAQNAAGAIFLKD